MRLKVVDPPETWLLSKRTDFWLVSAGGGTLLVALGLVLLWQGDRQLGAADILLGELHLGATYATIVRRRLWRRMPLEVLAIPLAIVAVTYALALSDGALVVTTLVLYLGAWHRGRQNLGIARYYQRHVGGAVSPAHRRLLGAAFYLPMVAAIGYYTRTAPSHEGEAFHRLALDPNLMWGLTAAAAASIIVYLAYTTGRMATAAGGARSHLGHSTGLVHPCERWLVLANALGFGSAYVLGAWTASFVLVLAIHHEVQYLYFTYAVARQAEVSSRAGVAVEARRLVRFATWPAIGLASWAACTASGLWALEPFLTAGLLGHYWLDGRIWTARARRLGGL